MNDGVGGGGCVGEEMRTGLLAAIVLGYHIDQSRKYHVPIPT